MSAHSYTVDHFSDVLVYLENRETEKDLSSTSLLPDACNNRGWAGLKPGVGSLTSSLPRTQLLELDSKPVAAIRPEHPGRMLPSGQMLTPGEVWQCLKASRD